MAGFFLFSVCIANDTWACTLMGCLPEADSLPSVNVLKDQTGVDAGRFKIHFPHIYLICNKI